MPVKIEEFVKIVDAEGIEREGKVIGQNFIAVDDNDTIHYGKLVKMSRVHSTILCDNEKCEQMQIGDDFVSRPFQFSFDDNGDGSVDFLRKINDLVVVSNYKGEKMCFCSPDCSAAYFRRVNREKIVDISHGKGTKTLLDEVINGRSDV